MFYKAGLKTNHQSKFQYKSGKGQVLVEYLLLLVVAVACATMLVNGLVGRGEEGSQGLIIKQWDSILKIIGNDLPECGQQKKFDSAKCTN